MEVMLWLGPPQRSGSSEVAQLQKLTTNLIQINVSYLMHACLQAPRGNVDHDELNGCATDTSRSNNYTPLHDCICKSLADDFSQYFDSMECPRNPLAITIPP